MGEDNRTSVQVYEEQKEHLEETREFLEEKNGYKPTQGETIVLACKALQGVGSL